MKFVRAFFTMVTLLISLGAYAAEQCEVNPSGDFSVSANIENYDSSETYNIYAKKANQNILMWSNRDNSAYIVDSTLEAGKNYDLRFNFEMTSKSGNDVIGQLSYYRKFEDDSYWVLVSVQTSTFHSGDNTEVSFSYGTLDCQDGVPDTPVEPTPIPDICTYVPNTLQTNYFTNGDEGTPYGNLSIAIAHTGEENKVILPKDDSLMSFFTAGADYCYYPSTTGPQKCKLDSTLHTEGYPLHLQDKFIGDSLNITAGTTQTLSSGEYWYDSIKFGNGSKLSIDGTVVIHYKIFDLSATKAGDKIHINDGGDSQDLLFIGHGSTASITTNDNTASITAYAHFYVDNATSQGLSLGGENNSLNGGFSGNAISISGRNNVINGAGGCGDDPTPPDPDPTPDDFCEYFPEPAQSWVTVGSSDYSSYPASQLIMSNGKSGQDIVGWTAGYIDANFIKDGYTDGEYGTIDVLKVGFDTTTDNSNLHAPGTCDTAPCDTGGADVDTRKIAPPPLLNATFPADGSADVDISPPYSPGQGYEMCDTSDLCTRTTDSTGTTVTIEGDISKLSVASNNGEHYTIVIDGEHTIKTLDVNSNNVEVIFKANSVTTVDTATFTQAPSITFEDNVQIKIQSSWQLNNSVAFSYASGAQSSLLYGPEATITITNPNMAFYGYILAKNLILSNNITIYGAVSANKLQMDTADSHIISSGKCFSPSPDDSYTLKVTPDYQFALLCQAPEMTYTVYNDDGSVATDYDGTITASYPEKLTPADPSVGTKNSDYVYTPNQGVVTVPVSSDTLGEYTVKAELTDDSEANDSGNVLFGPYKFDIDPVKAVAAHPRVFNVQVLACKDDKVTPVKGYSGEKDLTVSNVNLTKPTIGEGAVDGTLQVSNDENGVYSTSQVKLNFSDDAKSSGYLKYAESGSLNFLLSDPNFVCPDDYDGCEVTNDDGFTENVTTLQGIANVDVRPWTFAICEPNDRDMSGDSNGGVGFMPAGEAFALQVKPIIWQAGGSVDETDDIDVSNYCNAAVTQNFFITEAPTATVEVGSELATPENGRLGSGLTSDDGNDREHDNVANSGDKYYSYNSLKWQEVGSIKVTADTLANYLDMNINLGYRDIGRFYPHHLVRVSNDWDYASGHNGFAYMNQPIGMDYTLEAQSEDNSATWNYGLFDSSLQDELALTAINNDNGQSLLSRLIYTNQSTNGWSDLLTSGETTQRNAQYVVNYDDFEFLKKLGSNPNNSEYTSTPDGPYDSNNSRFGIAVTNKVDDLDFDFTDVDSNDKITLDADGNGTVDTGLAFALQPDFRYGRMTLDSVSGSIGGPVQVPLRTEFWDGESYIPNSDDSGSQFMTQEYCRLSNISGSDAYLTDTVDTNAKQTVSSGKSDIVRAAQITAQRETVRLFLRQGITQPDGTNCGWSNGTQPWLQFNWRDFGDEDPSTVVMFGAYRGNDRIIYRGEPNLVAD
ncbi:DUF6701 domain-containing protein [Vibrio rumoiensis]|uniref:DUF6701 domain-containing protein n=1 Tax=Vibrio rumoiensis 1S-45 TaxID=1188252 RepID=A0A1E5E544_9VIBR|nr:DUF6701 domain-containing protein [Vibrio rumoiensis]OEF28464.1 hypothetical protein A1QC_05375 [Vibrio rumoiensis 1S-45]